MFVKVIPQHYINISDVFEEKKSQELPAADEHGNNFLGGKVIEGNLHEHAIHI